MCEKQENRIKRTREREREKEGRQRRIDLNLEGTKNIVDGMKIFTLILSFHCFGLKCVAATC